jgi:hypothetical protein
LRRPLEDRLDISYTQWEAWLAILHDKRLLIVEAADSAPRGPRFTPTEASRAAQRAHLERLSEVERYPGCTFTSPDNLAKKILAGAILDLLAREALGAASIEQIETAVRAKSPKLTAAQIDRFIQSLRDLKGDPSFARAVEEARNGNTHVAEGIWLQILLRLRIPPSRPHPGLPHLTAGHRAWLCAGSHAPPSARPSRDDPRRWCDPGCPEGMAADLSPDPGRVCPPLHHCKGVFAVKGTLRKDARLAV